MSDFASTFSKEIASALLVRPETFSLPLPECYSQLCYDHPIIEPQDLDRLARANLPLSDRFVEGLRVVCSQSVGETGGLGASAGRLAVAVFLKAPLEMLTKENDNGLRNFLGTFDPVNTKTSSTEASASPLPEAADAVAAASGAAAASTADDDEEVWAAELDDDDFVYEDGNATAPDAVSASEAHGDQFSVPSSLAFPPHDAQQLYGRLAALLSLFSFSLISSLSQRLWDSLDVSSLLCSMATVVLATSKLPELQEDLHLRFVFALRDRAMVEPLALAPLLNFCESQAEPQLWLLVLSSLTESGDLRRDTTACFALKKFVQANASTLADVCRGSMDQRACVIKVVNFYADAPKSMSPEGVKALLNSGLLRELCMMCIIQLKEKSADCKQLMRMLYKVHAAGGGAAESSVYISRLLGGGAGKSDVENYMSANASDAVVWGLSCGWKDIAAQGLEETFGVGKGLGTDINVETCEDFLSWFDKVLYVLEVMGGGVAPEGEDLMKGLVGMKEALASFTVQTWEKGKGGSGGDPEVKEEKGEQAADVEKEKTKDVLMGKRLDLERVKMKLAQLRRRLKEVLNAGSSKAD
jgi:hypothetical protein